MYSTYVVLHVGTLLATITAVRAFESRRDAALVTEVTLQTFRHGVTVPALWAHVVLPPVSTSTRSEDDLRGLQSPRLPVQIDRVTATVQQTGRWVH